MTQRWYVIQTKANWDRRVAESLKNNGYDLCFPQVGVTKHNGHKVMSPLFPGYIFVNHDAEEKGWSGVLGLPGILKRVMFGGATPIVPDGVIDELTERVALINRNGGLWTRFDRGDTVRVISGNIETLAQVVEGPKSPQDRVRVLLEFMGRLVPAIVSWDSLRLDNGTLGASGNKKGHRRTRGRGRWIGGFKPPSATFGT